MCTASGEQHGLINTMTNSVPFDDFKNMDPKTKALCEKEKKEDARIVKVKYINKKGRVERLSKSYCRWAGDPIQQWLFIPNYEYEVPYGLVKEVNGKKETKRSGLLSQDDKKVRSDGSPLDKDIEEESEHLFVPVNF
jgi:hypothetical protein